MGFGVGGLVLGGEGGRLNEWGLKRDLNEKQDPGGHFRHRGPGYSIIKLSFNLDMRLTPCESSCCKDSQQTPKSWKNISFHQLQQSNGNNM